MCTALSEKKIFQQLEETGRMVLHGHARRVDSAGTTDCARSRFASCKHLVMVHFSLLTGFLLQNRAS